MVHLDKQEAREKYETLDGIGFIEWVTDGYLAAIGGGLTAENMDMLSAEQHAVLCYRYVLEGPFPMVVKKEWGKEKEEDPLCPADISPSMGRPCGEKATSDVMKKFSKLLYEVKKEYHKHQEELSQDMSDEEFMALYEQLEELNELGDDFLDEHQEEVTPAVAKMMVENLDKYV